MELQTFFFWSGDGTTISTDCTAQNGFYLNEDKSGKGTEKEDTHPRPIFSVNFVFQIIQY